MKTIPQELRGRVALIALLVASLGACIAQPVDPESEGKDGDQTATEARDGVEIDSVQAAATTTTNVATNAAIPPANPGPEKPQPSPWNPANGANPGDEGEELTTSPGTKPQPSPWGPPTIIPAVITGAATTTAN